MDQASTLRMMARQASAGPMQIYSITSGKGGVGKTSLVCNMAARFGQLGRRVLLIDADMGLANIDIIMGITPGPTLAELFSGEAELKDILMSGPPNVTILPSASGVQSMTLLTDEQILQMMGALDELSADFDVVFVDTGAGIGRNVLYFNAAAQDVIVVATPEPTSMTDAYATMKVLSTEHSIKRFQLIVNQVKNRKEALRVYQHLTHVADKYLDIVIDFLGHVPRDELVSRAVVERKLLILGHPDSPAAEAVVELVDQLERDAGLRPPSGNLQFFWRRLLGRSSSAP